LVRDSQMRGFNRWRHKKSGSVYEIITHEAKLQCASDQQLEDTFECDKWTVYKSIKTGDIWVRLTQEFMDGRFDKV